MNLQPLYEVQERLEHAAIAGAGLLHEDFRLKRAQEALAPLAAASPVFGKISAGLEALLTAPPESRGGALLDVLALVNAVVYTQAAVGVSGELAPLPPGAGTYQEASYGQLKPLLEALTGTGGGRYNVVQETFQNHPEFFADYRVLPALIAGLGDSYGDLADLNAGILSRQGPDILPLLEAGFDPAGKKEMARRVEVMAQTAGAKANAFFLAQLPLAKKEVRLALIDALGCDPANGPRLLELCQTERKGEARNRALHALARLDLPEGESYLAEQARKAPNELLELLEGLDSPASSRLTAQIFEDTLDQMEAEPDAVLPQTFQSRLAQLFRALNGKSGPEIAALYRRLAGLTEKQLDRQVEDSKGRPVPLRFECYAGSVRGFFRLPAALALCRTILEANPDPELLPLAIQLQAQGCENFLAPALAARLVSQSPEDVYTWAKGQLSRSGLLGAKLRKEALVPFRHVLAFLHWDEASQTYRTAVRWSALTCSFQLGPVAVPPLDMRWFSLLVWAGEMNAILLRLLAGRKFRNLPEIVPNYLYRSALKAADYNIGRRTIPVLWDLGWTQWGDFVLQWVKNNTGNGRSTNYYEIFSLLDQLPIPPKQKADQLTEISALVFDKKLKITSGNWPTAEVERYLAKWAQEAQMEGDESHG